MAHPLLLLCAAAVLFMGGALAVYFEYPPYQLIDDANMAYEAAKQKRQAIAFDKNLPPQMQNRVSQAYWEKGKALEGYTLFAIRGRAILIDMDGRIVHEWSKPFSQLWKDHPQVADPVPDTELMYRDAHLYPNGDLLAVHEANKGDTPYGYGLGRMDKDSKPLWFYYRNVHHRLAIGEDSTIYGLSHKYIHNPPGMEYNVRHVLDDAVIHLTPEGKEIDNVPLLEALVDSPYKDVLDKDGMNKHNLRTGDITHTNSATPLPTSMAAAFPMFKPGQVLVSIRNLSLIGMLDLKERRFVWATKGPWKLQHDAEFCADGTIMLYDNQGAGEQSRIVKYNPATNETKIVYEGTKEHPFFSRIRGMQQQLPNGDILITESQNGRIFEVAPDGHTVWEYLNPYDKSHSVINSARRYSYREITFLREH